MTIQRIFSTFLTVDYINLNNTQIADYCGGVREKSLGREISNRGGWQGELDLAAPELSELTSTIQRRLDQLHVELGYKKEYRQKVSNMWANFNKQNDYNIMHSHDGSFISGVYYVKCNRDSGDLIFSTPDNIRDWENKMYAIDHYNEFNSVTWKQWPEEGKLILFPAWIKHFVEPNKSNEERLSIAFNAKMHPIGMSIAG
jgi:uncharacterized protein (TIGR02466 family)